MRFRILMVMMMLLLAGQSLAADHSIPVTGGQSVMSHSQTRSGDMTFHVEVGQIEAMDVKTDGGDFTRLIIPGYHTSKAVGQPELPQMNRLINVPLGAGASVIIDNVRTRTIKLADYGIANLVMPVQPSLSKSADLDNIEFFYDRAAYQVEVAKAAVNQVSVVDMGTMRAMQMARLEVAPVEYLPLSGELRITESIDFRVVFSLGI